MAYSVVALLLVVAVTASNALSIVPFPKSGTCPRFYSLRPCLEGQVEPNACAFDHQCPGTLKCCQSTCGKTCAKPVRVCPVVNELVCGGLDCSSRGGFATDRNGCKVCLCARCPKGSPVVNCFADPCQVTKCKRFPKATCVSSYCGGCQANFFVNGKPVKCTAEDVCHLPKVPGLCKGYFPRWHHNPTTHQCERFIYGGCQGNANNFPSEDACNKKCRHPVNCATVLCPQPTCPNPIVKPGQCCGRCNLNCALVRCANPICLQGTPVVRPGECCGQCHTPPPTLSPCAIVKCRRPFCTDGQTPTIPTGECCPVCPPPVDCRLVRCAAPVCGPGQKLYTAPGQCCPVCRPLCFRVLCPPVFCPNPIKTPGQCCGTCTQDCRLVRCALPVCANGVKPVVPPGQCCASCPLPEPTAPTVSPCATVSCLRPVCRPGQELYTAPGQCCPVCRPLCFGVRCPAVFCPNPIKRPGQCCGTCTQDCRLVDCAAPICGPGQTLYTAPGQCCPVCRLDCRLVLCALPQCADGVRPVTKPGQCCPTCPVPDPTPTPVCSGQNEVYSQCGGICQPTCGSRIRCLACAPGCGCRPGYIRESAGGLCVRESQCPQQCGRNEEYTRCGGICQPTCTSTVVCRACLPGCSCKTGYIKRTANGPCIRTSQCPNRQCRRNEVYSRCGGSCRPTCSTINRTCPSCQPGCSCRPGYVKRSAYGFSNCIPLRQCPRPGWYPY